ncbi:hypothetical protein CQA01_11850 [Cyclobacterium qasimii]|uniref:Alpha glucuronidase N-terminal domain-containing protein n=3 Tax=Cyclobacterium qasimii TaxID=1350429 RepID=A0A512C8W4_9BACT|nr:hypothetical protein CQA01_11850 [Cyclobacterium qasimii]
MALNAFLACSEQEQEELDLSEAKILISPQIKSPIKDTAGDILLEEIEKRTGLHLGLTNNWDAKTTIALALAEEIELFGEEVPARGAKSAEELQKEGYRIFNENKGGKNTIWILGADARGILYGIGKLLRTAKMSNGNITIDSKIDFSEAPEYTLRGHQFGYRNTANSWDAWTVEQFDQHFREQVLFGANSFENIPFQEVNSSPHFKVDPQIMEVELSKICEKYDAEYWVWTPAPHDLKVTNAHQEGLEEQEAFFAKCPRLDGVFVPGGDPGENHPAQLIPYLNDLSARLHKYHPDAGIWVSLQGFNKEKVDYFFAYLEENNPDWLKGLVYGPSSPPIDLERERLPKKYLHRFYPDITHTVRCQYPVDNWDQAFALTLGREPCNPQPLMYTELFNRDSKFTDGFITYSDGSHDDVNKVLWSQLGVDPNNDPKEIVLEYTQFFFGPDVAEAAAQGIFALEENWDGPILKNNSIKETLALWKRLEDSNPHLSSNWRWQQLVMRAYYDAYIQDRLAFEKMLETEAYVILEQANTIGADKAMAQALKHINKADTELVSQDLKEKVFDYGEKLFQSIGAQSSVEMYQARSAERGAVLDFIDYPLNNRWWLEDEFKKIAMFKSEEEKLTRLEFIKNYEFPGEGSFYDNISSADAMHVTSKTDDAIDFLWENDGLSKKRLSTQLFQFSPTLEYSGLDATSDYLIRVSGYGEALLRANGQRLQPTKYEKNFEEFKEFPLSKDLITDGKLKISFDKPDEEHLNWRKQSRVTDVWVIKQ